MKKIVDTDTWLMIGHVIDSANEIIRFYVSMGYVVKDISMRKSFWGEHYARITFERGEQ
jgi:hypothetical protein